MKRIFCLILIVGPFIASSCHTRERPQETSAQGSDDLPGIIDDFESVLHQNLVSNNTGSFSAAIFKGDTIIWSKAMGKQGDQKSLPADTSTIYRIGSISKTITAYDLARLVIALTADTDLLSKNYRDTMQTIQTSENKNNGYGFGLMIKNNNEGIKMVGHEGLVAGFSSYMIFNPASRIGIIILRNCDNASIVLEIQGNNLLYRLVMADKKKNGK